MEEETCSFAKFPQQHHLHQHVEISVSTSTIKSLTVNIAKNASNESSSSSYNSPSLISPPSSAFVSALQSPYISPRATIVSTTITTETTTNPNPTSPPPISSYSASDVPSSSYTPPIDSTSFTPQPESYDFSDDPTNPKLKFMTYNIPYQDPPPRISFSFPVPRTSFTKNSISPSCNNAKLRSCDVYIGFHGQTPNLLRFCKWVKTELEIQGIACFVADRAKYSDNQNHEIADRVISSVTHGVVIITRSTLVNHLSMEEIRFFSQKKNFIPVFFGTDIDEIMGLLNHNSSIDHKVCKEAIEGLMKYSLSEFKVETNESNWRTCVSKIAGTLRNKLGRRSAVEKDVEGLSEELPFRRNKFFVGREKEITEIESTFFGYEHDCNVPIIRGEVSGQSEGLADEESDVATTTRGGRYINLELGRCKAKEPTLEAWIEPVVIGRNSHNKKSKYKKSSKSSNGNNVICINGVPGIGKTELALEFAYRYSQRYKMVLWVGGETRYFRQNILNLSINLGLDVSADAEKERGRIRSFDEQEVEAFKRVKKELFRDMPYLLIIDNLETEREWWEGKDLHDLIPRNTGGGTHVIITTQLPKVMNFDMMQVPQLSLSDAMVLMKGRRKKDYLADELEFLRKFDEKLGRLTFGLWVIGSLLSELAISPSALFEAINQVPLDEVSICDYISSFDDQICRNNQFLMKVLGFCMVILQQTSRRKNYLALRMFLVGAWFAPAPTSANLLAISAKNLPNGRDRFKKWTKCASLALCCCTGCCLKHQSWKSEEDAAVFLIRLGLARRCNNRQTGCWIVFHPISQLFAKRKEGLASAKATVQGVVKKSGNPQLIHSDHLWATAFMVFGFKSEPPLVQLKANDIVLFINRTALPLAIKAFTTFSRCNSALELLTVCTNVLEEVEKSFVSQIQDWCHGSLCWRKLQSSNQKVDEYLWQDVTLLKATLLETRAKLLLRGGHFDSGEELCRTCISIRTVMLGHNHNQTLAAQETLAKLVKMRSKI